MSAIRADQSETERHEPPRMTKLGTRRLQIVSVAASIEKLRTILHVNISDRYFWCAVSAYCLRRAQRSRKIELTIIQQAKKEVIRAVIVEPSVKTAKKSPSPPLLFRLQTMAHKIKARFLATLGAIAAYWEQSIDALRRGGIDRVLT